MLHTIITGKPGCGKTTIAHILSEIYSQLGVLKTNKIVVAKRDDLIS